MTTILNLQALKADPINGHLVTRTLAAPLLLQFELQVRSIHSSAQCIIVKLSYSQMRANTAASIFLAENDVGTSFTRLSLQQRQHPTE